MKLTPDEIEKFHKKKAYSMQYYNDIAITLNVDVSELIYVGKGSSEYPEVVQAVREWIE